MNKTPVSESPLGSLVTIKQGYTFSRSYQGNAEGKWMYVKVADLNSLGNKKYVYRTKNYIDDDVLEKIKATPFPANSIVFPRVGAALKLNNKLLLTEDCVTDDNVIVITVTDEEKCYFEYLYYWFEFQDLGRFCNSGAVPVISGKNLKKELVPLPPLDEQKKISRVLSEWDNAIEKTEALIAAKEKQFEWLLNNLIEDDFKSCKKTLSEYASIAKKEKILSADGEKLLTVKLHCKGIEPNTRDIKVVLSSKGRPYYQRLAGEFLIGRQNFHNGGFGIVPSELDGFIASNAITTLELNQQKLIPEYLFFHFSRKNYYLRVGHIMDGTGQKELSDKQIMKLPISAPSIKVQQDIVLKLSSAKEEIKLLQTLLDKYRSQKRGLMQKLLTGEWQVSSSQPVAEDMYQEASA